MHLPPSEHQRWRILVGILPKRAERQVLVSPTLPATTKLRLDSPSLKGPPLVGEMWSQTCTCGKKIDFEAIAQGVGVTVHARPGHVSRVHQVSCDELNSWGPDVAGRPMRAQIGSTEHRCVPDRSGCGGRFLRFFSERPPGNAFALAFGCFRADIPPC